MDLQREHAKILKKFQFEPVGQLRETLKSDEFDGARVIYAIANPEGTPSNVDDLTGGLDTRH